MILIDVHVPVLDQAYDFEFDEDSEVGMLMEEILDLLSNKEQLTVKKSEDIYLYTLGQENILERNKTLKQQGVCDGDRLILI